MDTQHGRMLWQEQGSPACGVRVSRMDPHTDTAPHDHLFFEIALVEQGQAQHQTADGTHVVREGQLMVIRPQVWHGYLHCTNMIVTNCLISTPTMHQMLPMLQDVPGVDDLLRKRNGPIAEETPTVLTPTRWVFSRLRDALQLMLAEQERGEPAWQAVNMAQVLQILALVVRSLSAGQHTLKLPQRTAQAVGQAAALIERNYTQDVSLPELAAAVHISAAHLSRSFKRQMGIGLVDYSHHLRIEEACRLLRLTDWPIWRIAARVGYSELAYFSRCFRRRMGKTPVDYRRMK